MVRLPTETTPFWQEMLTLSSLGASRVLPWAFTTPRPLKEPYPLSFWATANRPPPRVHT